MLVVSLKVCIILFGFLHNSSSKISILQLIMEESSQNKYRMNNNDEIYLNDVVMEEERMEKEYEIQPSLQIEENIDANEGKDKMKEIFKKKLKKWRR